MNAFFLIALAVAGNLNTPSPPPPPTPTEFRQSHQRATENDKQNANSPNGAPQSGPASENQPTPKPTATDIHAECTPKSNDSSTNGWGIFNAVLLTLFNGALAWIGWKQYHGMREQIESAKTSADAAKDSADTANKAIVHAEKTAHLTQRAVVLLESVVAKPSGGEQAHYFLPSSLLVFTLKNYGATVAYNVNVEGRIQFGGKTMRINGDPGMTMAPQGSNEWITASLIAELTAQEIIQSSAGNNLLSYVVDVSYDDVFEKHHEYRVTGSFIAPLRGFITGGSRTTD